MHNNFEEVKNELNNKENSLNVQKNLEIPPKLPTIPSHNSFQSITENKTEDGHDMNQNRNDTEQQRDWRMPTLKKEKTQDETEHQFLAHDFSTQLNNFPVTFDVTAIPGLLPPTNIAGQLPPNPFDLVPVKIPQTTRHTCSTDGLAPIDIRTLLSTGSRQGNQKTVAPDPVDIRGPVDIRNKSPNKYNNILVEDSLCEKGVGTKRKRTEKSLAGLPANLQELGVSKRLTKLEKLIRMDESAMTVKQRKEKVRLLRLEKNRRAAAISRERKKRYIRSLEERSLIMSKHLEALEMENGQLRLLLSQNNIQKQHTQKQNLPDSKAPNMSCLKPSTFDADGNLTPTESRNCAFPAMTDTDIPGISSASEGSGCNKLTMEMNKVPVVQTTVKRRGKKRVRVVRAGVDSSNVWYVGTTSNSNEEFKVFSPRKDNIMVNTPKKKYLNTCS